jgi:hypothetical protein
VRAIVFFASPEPLSVSSRHSEAHEILASLPRSLEGKNQKRDNTNDCDAHHDHNNSFFTVKHLQVQEPNISGTQNKNATAERKVGQVKHGGTIHQQNNFQVGVCERNFHAQLHERSFLLGK